MWVISLTVPAVVYPPAWLVSQDGPGKYPDLVKLREDVINFAKTFPTVGF